MIHIQDFDMEEGYDFLLVGNGDNSAIGESTIAALTGKIKLRTLASGDDVLWMRVATDRTGVAKGFELNVTQVANTEGNCFELLLHWLNLKGFYIPIIFLPVGSASFSNPWFERKISIMLPFIVFKFQAYVSLMITTAGKGSVSQHTPSAMDSMIV